jgi:hypothetical protein
MSRIFTAMTRSDIYIQRKFRKFFRKYGFRFALPPVPGMVMEHGRALVNLIVEPEPGGHGRVPGTEIETVKKVQQKTTLACRFLCPQCREGRYASFFAPE